jgi:hypothetical protein
MGLSEVENPLFYKIVLKTPFCYQRSTSFALHTQREGKHPWQNAQFCATIWRCRNIFMHLALANDTSASTTTTAAAPVANNSRASLLFYVTTSYVNKCRTIHGILPFLLIQAAVACLRWTCFFFACSIDWCCVENPKGCNLHTMFFVFCRWKNELNKPSCRRGDWHSVSGDKRANALRRNIKIVIHSDTRHFSSFPAEARAGWNCSQMNT